MDISGTPLRAVRAALFTALAVTLSTASHVLLSGVPLPLPTVAAVAAAVFLIAYALAGRRERGFGRIAALLIPLELAADTVFTTGQHVCYGRAGGPVAGPLRSVGFDVLCGDGTGIHAAVHTHDPHKVTVQLDAVHLSDGQLLRADGGHRKSGPEPSEGPVFVDASGRRSRLYRRLGVPRTRRGDHAGPGPGGEGDGGAADVPGAAPHVDGLPGPQPPVPEQGEPRGGGRVGGRHQVLLVDAGRRRVEALCGDRRVLGEGALPAAVTQAVAPDPLSDREARGTGPGRGDLAHQVAADDERRGQRCGVRARPYEGVHGIGGDGRHPHQYVRGPDRRNGQFPVPDGVGGSDGVDVRRPHPVRNRAVHDLMLRTARW